jgi:hypothetical protein
MFRKTVALLLRALRVDARLLRSHFVRFGLLATILWLLYIAEQQATFRGSPGLALFEMITMADMWFIWLIGVPYFGSAITEEKEERTLALLQMADVGGLALLLGKWMPRLLGMLMLLGIQFPFTLLSITLGGITQEQVAACYVALACQLLWVGSIALLGSVVCRTTANACRFAFLVLIARMIIPWLLMAMSGWQGLTASQPGMLVKVGTFLQEATVSALRGRALATTFNESIVPMSAWVMIGQSALVLLASWLLFEPFARIDLTSEPKPPFWRRIRFRRSTRPPRRAWANPLVGKDYLLLGGGHPGTIGRFVLYLLIVAATIIFISLSAPRLEEEGIGATFLIYGLALLAIEALVAAARIYRSEVHDQTWSSLVMLPRSLGWVSWSKLGGCLLGLWPPIALVSIGMLMIPSDVSSFFREVMSDATAVTVSVYVVLEIILALEITTWFSLAMTWAAWPVAAPLAVFAVIMLNVFLFTCLAFSFMRGGGDTAGGIFFMLDMAMLFSVIFLGVFIGRILARRASDST